jgi:prevent-host-death family protein
MDTHVITEISPFVSLYDAKTQLSSLVERAAAGEEIVIAKNGVPMAKLVAIPFRGEPRKPANAMGITYIAEDFDAADEEIIRMFEGSE